MNPTIPNNKDKYKQTIQGLRYLEIKRSTYI